MKIKRIIKLLIPKDIFKIFNDIRHDLQYSVRFNISKRYIGKLTRKDYSNNKIIRVGFIVQMPEIWDKEAPVYEYMLRDERFEPMLLVVPSYDYANSSISHYGSELEYYSAKYRGEKIVELYSSNSWLDIKKLNLDYVFYQRCWESYLPEQYHAKEVVKYAKTCYIPYFAAGLNDGKEYYRTDFFTNMYISFCSTKEQVSFYPRKRCGKVVFLGSPVIEQFFSLIRNEASVSKRNVLWTPRWSEDEYYGGSTFIKNMYNILNIKKKYSNINLVLRPHPMAFQNAIKERKLTKDEVDNYKEQVQKLGGVFDNNVFVAETIANTNILITDYSSIIIEYFLTGNPIIYCSNIDLNFEEIYKKISKCFYIAREWDDVEHYVGEILSGKDVLKSKREEIIESIRIENKDATKNIVDYIVRDHNS